MRRHVSAAILMGLAWVLVAGCGEGEPGATDGEGAGPALTIPVIPKGTTHEFWKSIHAGAVKAERDLQGVRIIWQGPIKEDDRDAQIQVLETFIQKRVDGIVLAPLDDMALVRPVQDAREAGIPVVIIDSDLADDDAYVSFVATDNTEGGRLAARRMAELLGPEGGQVVVLRYQVGSASTMNREAGFLEEIARRPAIEVLSRDQYGGATVESAMSAAETLLASPAVAEAVDGIFCPNESTTYGMLQALRARGLAGKVIFVGFDVSAKLIEALRAGELHGLVVQDPCAMGERGVRTLVAHLQGEDVPKRIDTGVTVVTKTNLDEPEIQRLLHPPLDTYLD